MLFSLSLSLSSHLVAGTSLSGDRSVVKFNEGAMIVGFLLIVGPILIVRFHPLRIPFEVGPNLAKGQKYENSKHCFAAVPVPVYSCRRVLLV
jgi:hypothetical protein